MGEKQNENTLRIFTLCEELKELLGNKEAIADLKVLFERHSEDGMFDNMESVATIIDEVIKKTNYPRIVVENPKPQSDKDYIIGKQLNDRKMGDVGIRNDEGTNVIFHANEKRIGSLKSHIKKKIVAIDGRDALTPYTQAQSLDGRLVQKNISSTATTNTIPNPTLNNTKIQSKNAIKDTLELQKLDPLHKISRVQETEVAKSLNNGEVAHTTTPPIANSDSATIPNPTLNNTETTNLKQITRDTAVLAPQSSALLIKTYEQLGEEKLAHTLISTIETDKVTMQEVSKHYLALDNNTDELKAQLSELAKQQAHTQTLSEGAEQASETAETKNDNKPKGPRQ